MTEIVTLPTQVAKSRFALLLPLFFAAASGLGAVWPGHSGQLFCIGALAGIWACLLIEPSGEPSSWVWPTLVGGMPILFLLGRVLDRLQSDIRVWAIAAVGVAGAAGFLLLQQFADLDRAVAHHGSFFAFCVCAVQLGGYGATLVALVVGTSRVATRTS